MIKDNRRSGFTLLELLTVMAIMLLIMGLAVGAFVGMGKGDRLRAGVSNIRSTLSVARQTAICKGTKCAVQFDKAKKSWNITEYNRGGTVQAVRENYFLPQGISFESMDLPSGDSKLVFRSDGGLGKPGEFTIKIYAPKDLTERKEVIIINGLTGITKSATET